MEYNIRQQFESAPEVLSKECRINNRLFLIGVSVQIATHILHAVQNMPRLAFLGTLKNKMFHKMRHALFILQFITGSGINCKATFDREGSWMMRKPFDNVCRR